ncbi:MAG: 5'-3' exonuclease H3TH domain-containing protein [Dehalococcoidia bacterium]|nr:5'-3' exonuclease H3TH domain-containing protein [Dehalococcoidia bacterium]
MTKPRLVLFDGNALVHRAFHALPPLTVSKTGEMVGAVYGFALMLLKTIGDLKPTHYAIAFDKKTPTFRHQLYDQYKATRPKTPEELSNQFARVKELVEAFSIPIFEIEGYEADDILGSLAKQASQQDIETIIVTGDADIMQLVSPSVKVLYPRPGGSFSDTTIYDESAVEQKYGIKPSQIVDFKALKGDQSDNIPGVPGVGDKTAAKLLQQFRSIDEIYKRIEEVEPPKLRDKLKENEALARRSKELATIVTETPVTLDLDACCQVTGYERGRVTELLRELEFYSLVPKLPELEAAEGVAPAPVEQVKTECHIINTAAALDELLKQLSSVESFAFDTEATGLNAMLANLVGISFSFAPGQACYIPVGHVGMMQAEQLPLEQVIARLKPLLEDPRSAKLTHNGKFDMTLLAENGIEPANVTFDTSLAAYLLGEKTLTLKAIAFNRLAVEMTPITDLIGTGAKQITMAQLDIDKAAGYACADADITYRLTSILKEELEHKGLWRLFAEVEMPLVPVLIHMERSGVAVDLALLRQMSERL